MKEIFLLLFFLFPYSKTLFNMQEIKPCLTSAQRLRTNSTNDHFFIDVNYPNKIQYIYFYLSDISYGLHTVSYCLTKENPDSGLHTCIFNELKAYNTKNSGNEKEYFYKADINGSSKTKQYIIVKYSGYYTRGSKLYAIGAIYDRYNDFYKELKTLNIIFIVIGSIIILSIILYVIFYCLREKTVIDNIQEPVNISTPSYSLVS